MASNEWRYIGPNLADLVTEATFAATRRAERSIVDSGTRRLYEVAKSETPVETGTARESWIQHEPEPRDAGGYEGRITNSDDVAVFLEYGTKPHDISPKGEGEDVSWIDPFTGQRAFARSVHHPGIQPHFMTARAGVALEANLPEIAHAGLEQWATECEAVIDAMIGKTR
jgi:hypothetical protein